MIPRHQNSLVGVISALLDALRHDLSRIHPAHSKELTLDFRTIERRLANEGLSFVTSTLPALGKAVLQSFLSSRLEAPQGFKKLRGTSLPRLLSGLIVQGYEKDGTLRTDCDPVVIKSLLQVTFLCYKLELPFTEGQISSKLEGFLKAESDLRRLELEADDPIICKARQIVQEIFQGFNPKEILPGHGPGALATGEKCEGKWQFKRLYTDLHQYYPYHEYFVPSQLSLIRQIEWFKGSSAVVSRRLLRYARKIYLRTLRPLDIATSKMCFVPKDSRGPRIISMEPLEVQFVQQGLKDQLYRWIERHPLTKGFVNFTDQTINGRLAMEGSLNGNLATLDMKEASDRVSLALVRCLFHGTELLPALEAVRSSTVQLPEQVGEHSGKVMELYKYAPMGSATCFPVEAICFYALSCAIILFNRGHLNARKLPHVYVYGDDIVVGSADAKALKEFLPKFGLLVNADKSYDRGPFRESCGSDCFKGHLVTPIKLRKPWSETDASPLLLASYAEYSNAFYKEGYYSAASTLAELPSMRSLSRAPLKSRSGTAIRRVDLCDGKTRYSKKFQRVEVLRTCVRVKTRESKLGGESRLFANLVGKYTEQYAVPYAADCKLRWVIKEDCESAPEWLERLNYRQFVTLVRKRGLLDCMGIPGLS